MSQVRNVRRAVINCNSNGANTLVAGVAGEKIKIFSLQFTVDAATNITWKSDTTAISGVEIFSGSGSSDLRQSADDPIYITGIGEAFVLSQSGTASIQGELTYTLT